jgi:hypothetical protein
MRDIVQASAVGLRITNSCNPKVELVSEPNVIIDGVTLNGVMDYSLKSSETGSELLIRLNVVPA